MTTNNTKTTQSSRPDEHPELRAAIDQVLQYNSGLYDFYYGDLTIAQQSAVLAAHQFHPKHIERQQRYAELIHEEVERLFNEEERKSINLQLSEGIVANTADHHALVNHPVILGCNLMTPYERLFKKQEGAADHLTLATSIVPLNEVLTRRGFDFHGEHYNLFSKKEKNVLVYARDSFDWDFVAALQRSKAWWQLNEREQQFFEELTKQVQAIDFSTCTGLADQLAKVKFHMWPLYFEESLRDKVVNMISLAHEPILIRFMEEFFAEHTESFMYQALFNTELRKEILELFDGVYGAWGGGAEKGTHFFWGIGSDKRLIRLELRDGRLRSTSPEKYQLYIPFEPAAIIEELHSGNMLPNIFTKFGIVQHYLGFFLQAGIGQTAYTTEAAQIWRGFLERHFPEELEWWPTVDTFGLNSFGLVYARQQDGSIAPRSPFDLMFDGGINEAYFDTVSQMNVRDTFLPIMDITYHRMVPAGERRELHIPNEVTFEGWQWLQ